MDHHFIKTDNEAAEGERSTCISLTNRCNFIRLLNANTELINLFFFSKIIKLNVN